MRIGNRRAGEARQSDRDGYREERRRKGEMERLCGYVFSAERFFSIDQIAERTTLLFGQFFSEKLFRAQLSYFDDINYIEPVEFMQTPIPESEIKEFLIEKAMDIYKT